MINGVQDDSAGFIFRIFVRTEVVYSSGDGNYSNLVIEQQPSSFGMYQQ